MNEDIRKCDDAILKGVLWTAHGVLYAVGLSWVGDNGKSFTKSLSVNARVNVGVDRLTFRDPLWRYIPWTSHQAAHLVGA